VLLLTYHGMKPLTADVHAALAEWVKQGGRLVGCDDDSDPYHAVRDWWNSGGNHYTTPRKHLFEQLGFKSVGDGAKPATPLIWRHGKGEAFWLKENPVRLAQDAKGEERLIQLVKQAAQSAKLKWRETNYLLLRRGPYLIAAGLDESVAGEPKQLRGRFVNLFHPELKVQSTIELKPGTRYLLRDLETGRSRKPELLASACKALPLNADSKSVSFMVEGVGKTAAVVLLNAPSPPRSITLASDALTQFKHSKEESLLWLHFSNEARPRELTIEF
jgi:hypothetical protein